MNKFKRPSQKEQEILHTIFSQSIDIKFSPEHQSRISEGKKFHTEQKAIGCRGRQWLSDKDFKKAQELTRKIGLARTFDEAEHYYQQGVRQFPGNSYIRNTFIVKAGKYNQFKAAKNAFVEAKKLDLADEVTYNSFINVAGKNSQFKETELAFIEVRQWNLADGVTYNSFIDAAGKNGKFAEAKSAFAEAKQQGLANPVTYASFIDAAGKNGKFAEAKSAFAEAKQRGLANPVTYASFIDAAGKNGEFAEAKLAFIEAEKRELADEVIYTSFIDAAGKNGEFAEAKLAFIEAKKLKLADVVTYNSFIDAAGKNGKFAEAKSAFAEAKQRGLANPVTYTSFIDAVGKNGKFAEAKSAFAEAKQRGLANNPVTYASFIDAAGKNGEFAEAKSAYAEAKQRGLANTVTYASFIDAAGKNGEFAEAKSAYAEAKKRGLANTVTYTSFIDAAGKNGEFAEAKLAFIKVKKLHLANVITYSSFIDAAGKSGQFAEAQLAFSEAKSTGFVDTRTYSNMMTAAHRNSEYAWALTVYEEARDADQIDAVTQLIYLNVCYDTADYPSAKLLYQRLISDPLIALPLLFKIHTRMSEVVLTYGLGDQRDLEFIFSIGDKLEKTFFRIVDLISPQDYQRFLTQTAGFYYHLQEKLTRFNQNQSICRMVQECGAHLKILMPLLRDYLATFSVFPSLATAHLLSAYFPRAPYIPPYQALTLPEITAIQRRVWRKLNYGLQPLDNKTSILIPKFNLYGRQVGEYAVNSSIFCTMTGHRFPPYGIVDFGRPIKPEKIPLFIQDEKKQVYRLDIMGGSKLKVQASKQKYGSAFAVPIESGEFLEKIVTSEEGFYYTQRALAPESPDQNNRGLRGRFRLKIAPDKLACAILGEFIVQDGCGYIKASLVERMGISVGKTSADPKPVRLPYQASHYYHAASYPIAAQELFALGQPAVQQFKSGRWDEQKRDELYYALSAGLPNVMAMCIPVRGDGVILPNTLFWQKEAASALIVGRNPYSSPLLQAVARKKIQYSNTLKTLAAIQYSLTGYAEEKERILAHFYKGILVIVPDEQWKAEWACDIWLSAKDKKLYQGWRSLAEKTASQSIEEIETVVLHGELVVKSELNPGSLFGLGVKLAKRLNADYDGDECNLISGNQLRGFYDMVRSENKQQIPNVKQPKTFTPRTTIGNMSKIYELRTSTLEKWSVISVVVQSLPVLIQVEAAKKLADYALLSEILGETWPAQLRIEVDCDQGKRTAMLLEIQLGMKCGEDAFKTKVPQTLLWERAIKYEQVLRAWNPQLAAPYGKGLQRRLQGAGSARELDCVLATLYDQTQSLPKVENIIGKVLRGLLRGLTKSGEGIETEAYLSEDEPDECRESKVKRRPVEPMGQSPRLQTVALSSIGGLLLTSPKRTEREDNGMGLNIKPNEYF